MRDARVGIPVVMVALLLAGGASPADGQHVDRLAELLRRSGEPGLVEAQGVLPADGGWEARITAARASGRAVDGSLPVLIVPALFQDSGTPVLDAEELRRIFFEGPSPRGTLPEFYAEASGDRLEVTGATAPWHRTGVSRDSATGGPASTFGIGPGFGDYLVEALAAADQALDFGQFDNDGPDGVPNSGDDNGVVDVLSFFFREVARSCQGPGVWPHFSGVSVQSGSAYVSDDLRPDGTPVEADPYLIVSASECDGSPVQRTAVIAHELGHQLGLPDLYHPIGDGLEAFLSENRRWVVGCFGLMAAGSWGCGPADLFPAFGPTHLSAWSRERLGWGDVQTVPGDVRREEYLLEPAWSSGALLRIPLDAAGDEALLVEYRPAEGWDQELPASGILVYRHDLGAPFRPDPTGPRRYRISLVEADDDSTLVRNHGEGGNRGEAPDVFAAGGPAQILSAASRPHTRRADGSPGSVTVHEMEVVDGQARVVVSTHPTPGVVQEGGAIRLDALETASGEILLGGGALPYQVDVQGLPAGVTFVEEADRLALEGRPTEVGPFAARVTVVDATGTRASSTAELHVVLVVDLELLMHGLVEDDAGALSAERRGVLDTAGNGNGRYDAGDLRAHLLGG